MLSMRIGWSALISRSRLLIFGLESRITDAPLPAYAQLCWFSRDVAGLRRNTRNQGWRTATRGSSPQSVQVDNPAANGDGYCFRAIMHRQFGQDVFDMTLDGLVADLEIARDLLVSQTPRHKP